MKTMMDDVLNLIAAETILSTTTIDDEKVARSN